MRPIIDIFNKSVLHMKEFLLLLLLALAVRSHIYSSTPKVTYNYNGSPLYFSLYMSLQNGIGASDYLRLIFYEKMYVTAKTEITVNLIAFSNNLQVATTTCVTDSSANNILHVSFGYAMQPNTWYEVQVYPNQAVALTAPNNFLVQVLAVSSTANNNIIYDSNLAFGYVDVLSSLATTGTLAIVGNSSSSQKNVPAAIYSYDIYVTPTVASSTGGNFTLFIYYSSADATQNTGTSLNDFTFMGLCQSAATTTQAAAVLNYCSISADLSTITFSLNSVVANQAIRISTSVSNPPYYSIRGIKGYWTEFISGKVKENGFVNNALQVSQISINTVSPRVLLFWGIDGTYTDSTITTALPLFRAANPSPNILQYNSFNIGFSFAATSPITGRYIVQMNIGSQGVLEASIAHNLPAYSGTSVYCYYDNPNIVCKNVGAFINTAFRYFISGKAFFNSSTVSPNANFGAVSITPVVYDNSGNLISSPKLYINLAGQSTTVVTTQQFLDTSGYHNTGLFQIGNAQVVSYYDDQSLSSTANAIQGFLQGTNSTVGVVPSLGTTQQLLFLLNTPTSSISSGPSTSYTIQLMFNNAVIGFESSAAGRGLDFVGYGTSGAVWSITTSPCYYSTTVCEKYNNNTPTVNVKSLVNTGASTNFYGMYNFQCGSSYTTPTGCSSNCATECTMFTGYSLTNTGSAVMAMRQVTFPSGYQSPIYADGNLLDFLFIFSQGSSVISYCLINGYTVTGADMQNIKASYVNYFDNSVSNAYNKGSRIPMMVRIGGGVLPSESLSASAIGIFFDDNVDASTFYTSSGNSWAIGCSTGTCSYFQNRLLANARMDSWLTSRSVIVYSLPPIQNEFNILVPVTPDNTSRNPPRILTIAFFSQNYTVGGVSGLLRTLNVFRLFGPVTTGSLSGSIGYINGLAKNGGGSSATPDIELTTSSPFATYGSFSVSLNTTNMYSNPTNNTFTAGNSDNDTVFGTTFGAGYTITSFYYNIFASSTLQWNQPPSSTATTCTIFGYVYNQIQNSSANTYKNGQWMYVGFCPIDSTFNLQTSAANIDFVNPQYPTYLTNNFDLRSLLTYSYSNPQGYLRAFRRETNAISSLVRSCTTSKLATYNPSSSGKQRAAFTLTVPAITLGTYAGHVGYMSFQVNFAIPSSTVGSSGLTMLTICDVSLSTLSCTVSTATSSLVVVTLTYTGTTTTTVTYLQINLYATASSTFGTAAAYTVTVYLPQYDGNMLDYVPFGNSFTSAAIYATCSSSFTVGITPYGTVMNLNSLSFNSVLQTSRSKITFTFGASSYRDAFFTTSTYQFNFGFLTNPNSATYFSRSNFRCMVYEGTNVSSLALSSSWSTLTLSSFSSVVLTPKAEIANPASIVYNLTCYGGAVPDGTNTTAISGSWQDGGVAVQSATGIAYSSASYTTSIPATISTFLLNFKRFSTSGFKSLYSFQLSCTAALTSSAVFYFDFHMALNPYLDNEGVVECYLRNAIAIVDSSASYTYCTFVNPWQLMVWNNQALAAGTSLYVDVFNIDQPKNADLNGNSKIGLSIDSDSNYANGILAYRELTDTQPPNNAASDIIILSSAVDSNYILSTQTLSMTIDTQTTTLFNSANTLYVLFPSSYSQWITRAQTLSITYPASTTTIYCEFNVTGATTNLATACTFISQRILKISVGVAANQHLFSLRLMNLMTPASVPSGKFNQYRFKLFISDAAQTAITYYSFTDYSQYLTLTTNPSLISLSWNYYGLSVSDSMFTYTVLTNQVITIQQGYYSNAIQLRQSIYPANFKATLTLTLANYAANYFSFLGGSLAVVLGKPLAYFRIAGNTAPAGLYTLVFTKAGDTNSQYTNIPPLTLVVQNTLCPLTTDAATYTIPIGGSTLPILINAINCIPTNNISIAVTFSGTGNAEFSVSTDLSSLLLTSSSVDGQIYIVIKHTQASLVAGNSVTASFTISGANSAYYASIASITLTLVDPTTFQTYPTATSLSAPTLSANTATFQMQCSQASLIFWGIGVYPSILNYQAVDFQARIISGTNGLMTNFTEANDYFAKVYGIRQGSTMQVITKKLYNLESNINYLFKYFCMNQLGHISDSQSINFTSSNYGAYLMKVEVTFRGSITYGQYNDLACSMAQNFIIPYTRVLTEAMSSCGNTPYTFYASDSTTMLNPADSSGWYTYGFYIQPDYTLASDTTNTNIRNQLSVSTSATTIITSTNNYIGLPSLVQMQTYDIQIYTTPIMTLYSTVSGLTSVVITAAVTNMNGFIVIGALNQEFNSSTMTLPSTTNIKQGIFSQNVSLVAVQMIHVAQNYNATFQFTGLTANTLYSFFYFCTVEDPSIVSLASTVMVTTAQTLQVLTININWNPNTSFFLLLTLVLLLLL